MQELPESHPEKLFRGILGLPRWARVALAARCARRVLPLYRRFFPDCEPEQAAAVARAVVLAEQSAAGTRMESRFGVMKYGAGVYGQDDGDIADHAALAAHNSPHPSAAAAAFAASGAIRAIAAPIPMGATDETNQVIQHAYTASHGLDPIDQETVMLSISQDLATIISASERNSWNDATYISPSVFGPMWRDNPPAWWPKVDAVEASAPSARRCKLAVRSIIGEFAPADDVADKLVELYSSLNEWHIAAGGSGLEIDDWQTFTNVEEPAEVLS